MSTKRILIVDDSESVRELLRATLMGIEDFSIFEARDGKEAIEIARREKPDVVLMDAMMPGEIDGYEAARRLKADPDLSGIKVVMLTARGQGVDMDLGRKIGAEAYFVKPFSPAALLGRLQEMFG